MSRRMDAFSCLALVLSGIVVGGCSQSTAVQEYYILGAARKSAPVAAPNDATLDVRRLSVDSAFAKKDLIYRLGEFQYEPDFYRAFLISPGAMITEQTRRWLADSGLFKQVLSSSSQTAPTYTLEGTVAALYGDFRDEAAPVAVMEIRYFLVEHKTSDGVVVFSQFYRAANPVLIRTVQALMDALGKDLTEILTRLEADLQTTLAEQAAKTGHADSPAP